MRFNGSIVANPHHTSERAFTLKQFSRLVAPECNASASHLPGGNYVMRLGHLRSPGVQQSSPDSGCIIKQSLSPTLSTWPDDIQFLFDVFTIYV